MLELSRFLSAIPLKAKLDTSQELLRYIRHFKRHSGYKVRVLHTNGGTKFKPAIDYLENKRVEFHISIPYSA